MRRGARSAQAGAVAWTQNSQARTPLGREWGGGIGAKALPRGGRDKCLGVPRGGVQARPETATAATAAAGPLFRERAGPQVGHLIEQGVQVRQQQREIARDLAEVRPENVHPVEHARQQRRETLEVRRELLQVRQQHALVPGVDQNRGGGDGRRWAEMGGYIWAEISRRRSVKIGGERGRSAEIAGRRCAEISGDFCAEIGGDVWAEILGRPLGE